MYLICWRVSLSCLDTKSTANRFTLGLTNLMMLVREDMAVRDKTDLAGHILLEEDEARIGDMMVGVDET